MVLGHLLWGSGKEGREGVSVSFSVPSLRPVLAVVSDSRRSGSSSQSLAAALLAQLRVQHFSLIPLPKHHQG